MPRRAVGVVLTLMLLGAVSQPAAAQFKFITKDDINQVPINQPKPGNVIPNDENENNLDYSQFAVTPVSLPINGTVVLDKNGSYVYTPKPGFTGEDSFTYRICEPVGATPVCSNVSTVRLTIYDNAIICSQGNGRNLLKNPDFNEGRTGFETSYNFIGTRGFTPGLYPEGNYAVDEDARDYHGGFQGKGRTSDTQPGDKFMIVNGAGRLVAVYSQEVEVLPKRYYRFRVYATALNTGDPAQLALAVDNKSTSAVVTLNKDKVGEYQVIEDLYYSGLGPAGNTGGSFKVKIEILDVNKATGGNDFGIDDVYFGTCRASLTADDKNEDPVGLALTKIEPLSATLITSGSPGVTVASFTVKTLPSAGTLYYDGVPVFVGQVIPVASPGSYRSADKLTYLAAGGCKDTQVVFKYSATDSDGNESDQDGDGDYRIPVEPIPVPTVRVNGTVPVCPGAQVTLKADPRPGFLYTWYRGTTIVNGGGAVPNDSTLTTTVAGSYTVKVQKGDCEATSNPPFELSFFPDLVAGRIGDAQTLCAGAVPRPLISLANATGGPGTYDYQWESSTDNVTWNLIPGATSAIYPPGSLTITTSFRRKVRGGDCGSATTLPVTLTVLPALNAGIIGGEQTVCAGKPAAALTNTERASGAGGTYTYQWESSTDGVTWNPIDGADRPGYDQPGVLTTTTRFRRRVTASVGGCDAAFTWPVEVQVQPLLKTAVTLNAPAEQCPGVLLTFTATPVNAGANPGYRWRVNNQTVPGATGPTFSSNTLVGGDQVLVEITPTADLCSTGPAVAVALIKRRSAPAPTVAVVAEPAGPVCPGTTLRYSVAPGIDVGVGPQYQWQVDGVDVAGAQSATFTSSTLRDGQRVALVLRTNTACGVPVVARSNELPLVVIDAQVNAGPDQEIIEGDTVVLRGTATNAYQVAWSPSESLRPGTSPLRPIAAPTETTVYTLSAGLPGCRNTSQVRVVVKPYVRIPNAFTPNSDGRDDTWQIERIENFPGNQVSILNRWGNPIFETKGYNRSNEWSGLINGQPAP
ncbi:MAG TPA: gliding motility-associated C-terminal domain-containing protein, partial [Hymenobacter sp.]